MFDDRKDQELTQHILEIGYSGRGSEATVIKGATSQRAPNLSGECRAEVPALGAGRYDCHHFVGPSRGDLQDHI